MCEKKKQKNNKKKKKTVARYLNRNLKPLPSFCGDGLVRIKPNRKPLKPVSHQPYDSRAPVCDDKFLGFARQPQGVVNNTTTARLPYEKTRSHGCRNVEN